MSKKQLYFDFGEEFMDDKPKDKTYTAKKKIVQYEDFIKEDMLIDIIIDCIDSSRYHQLISEIDRSNVSERNKKFLKLCATRHIRFDFSKIASHYVTADKEMQELMEQQGLVIIDFDDAIENGYAHLADSIDKMSEKDYITAQQNGEEKDDEA